MSDDLFKLPCVECEQPMVKRSMALHYEGDYEVTTFRFECQSGCQTAAEVTYRTFIPLDIARRRAGA